MTPSNLWSLAPPPYLDDLLESTGGHYYPCTGPESLLTDVSSSLVLKDNCIIRTGSGFRTQKRAVEAEKLIQQETVLISSNEFWWASGGRCSSPHSVLFQPLLFLPSLTSLPSCSPYFNFAIKPIKCQSDHLNKSPCPEPLAAIRNVRTSRAEAD